MTDDYLNDDRLDRLVDGELPADERRQMIAALDARPDGWRRCALAFLEAQSWRSDMRRLMHDETVGDHRPDIALAPVTSEDANLGRAFSSSRLNAALAVAASLLVAFGLGSQWRWPRGGTAVDEPTLAVVPQPELDAQPHAPDVDAVTLVLNDASGAQHRIKAPLVEGSRLGQGFADTPQWSTSPELQRRLGEKGLGVAARRRYVPLYFQQQDRVVPMVVPVDDAVVAPVKRKVF
jgi:hypothetical protein